MNWLGWFVITLGILKFLFVSTSFLFSPVFSVALLRCAGKAREDEGESGEIGVTEVVEAVLILSDFKMDSISEMQCC